MIDEYIGLSGSRRIRGLDRFNTKTGVVTVVCEEGRYSSYLRFYRVYRELGKRELVCLIVLKVGYVGAEVLF
jgi:hypothetical protein